MAYTLWKERHGGPMCQDAIARLSKEALVRITDTNNLPGKPSRRQLHDWRIKGVIVAERHLPVLLECVRIGGRYYTTQEAFLRFLRATNL